MAVWYLLGHLFTAACCSKTRLLDQMEPKHRAIAVNKMIAQLHAIYATVHAVYYFFYFLNEAPDQRNNCSESTWRSWRRLYPAGFVGYLLLDFIMELFKKNPGPMMLVHHLVFAFVAFVCMAYEKGCLQYTVTLMTEVSTVVFVFRWFLIATKKSQNLIKIAEGVFAFLFFAMRIIGYGYGTWMEIRDDADAFSDTSFYQLVPTMYIIGYFLQVFWMYEIVMMALRPPRKPMEKSGRPPHKDLHDKHA